MPKNGLFVVTDEERQWPEDKPYTLADDLKEHVKQLVIPPDLKHLDMFQIMQDKRIDGKSKSFLSPESELRNFRAAIERIVDLMKALPSDTKETTLQLSTDWQLDCGFYLHEKKRGVLVRALEREHNIRVQSFQEKTFEQIVRISINRINL